jgi:hypothetical protein
MIKESIDHSIDSSEFVMPPKLALANLVESLAIPSVEPHRVVKQVIALVKTCQSKCKEGE